MPSEPAAEDRFLNVLTTMDVGTPAPTVKKLESESLIGTYVAGHAVLFNKSDEVLDQASFELPGAGSHAVLVCGVKPGSWSIVGSDRRIEISSVSEAGKCLYFRGRPGRYQLHCG